MASTSVHAQFSTYSADLLDFQDRRERLIKSSRDITTASKRLIFLLHRFPCSALPYGPAEGPKKGGEEVGSETVEEERKSKRAKHGPSAQATKKAKEVMEEAVKRREEILKMLIDTATREGLSPWAPSQGTEGAGQAAQDASVGSSLGLDEGQRAYRYDRPIGPGLEEMIEALSFMHFLETGKLISDSELQRFFNDKEGRAIMPIPTQRYLLGLSDLTGELMRFATNAIGSGEAGSIEVVRSTLALMRDIKDALDPFVNLIWDMRKKQQVTTQSVRKIEDVLYAVAVRSSEYGSDPAMLQEIVRRALSSASGPAEEARDEN